ncbi:MAG: hypothetical protein AB7U98_15540 [Candidatus Nitrosocosmicus sp.]
MITNSDNKMNIGKWVNNICNKIKKNNSTSSSRTGDTNKPINE